MPIDPVCKMEVDENDEDFTSKYKDIKYFFCSQLCKIDFDKNPDKFLK